MVFGFGGQDEEEDMDMQASPTSEVRRLASQGLSEQEIIDELRSRGYSNTQIKRSLNKVLKYQVSNTEGDAQSPARSPEDYSSGEGFVAPPPSQEPGRERRPSPDVFERFEQEGGPVWEMTEEEEIELEELIEEIINEKWTDVRSYVDEFEKERKELKERVDEMEDKIRELESKHEKEREKLEDKVDRTFSHIETIESRVGSVEKAFKEFLPSLTQNVRSLSGIVRELKSETGRSTTQPSSAPSSDIPSPPKDYLSSLPTDEKEGSEDKEPSALE